MADITSDMISSFFNLSKPIVRKPKVVVNVRGPPPSPDDSYKPEFKLQKKNKTNLSSDARWTSIAEAEEDGFLNGDSLSALDLSPPEELAPTDPDAPIPAAFKGEDEAHIFENYSFDHVYSPDLPITQYQQDIVNTIESNSVCVIHGPTGSGKTTQVPQYLLDNYAKDRRYCNILVTQPRRIAATSIAKRVCQERNCTLGSLVGYQVARDKCISEDTRIVYVTTGVLLQKLIGTKNMNQYTHIIIDEVHERDQDTDFCLLVVRKLLRSNSRHVKIILMSATLQSNLFSRYFSTPVRGKMEGAPIIGVEGRIFPVQEIYLDDMASFGQLPNVSLEDPGISDEAYELAARLIISLDVEEKKRLGVDEGGQYSADRGTVLIFLPGIQEIKRMDLTLEDLCANSNLLCLPLHSQITIEEQSRVFLKPDKGVRKVILSTNIAESSITVPDIKYVIDFCLVKCLICDPETNFQTLRTQWAAKSSCIQRRGRAGRVSAGTCYRMVSREFYESCLTEFGIPEMQRCPLEAIVLQVKLLDLGEPRAILRLALQPPDLDDIERTVLLLKQVGALTTQMKDGYINPHDGDLTFIGRVLGTLPVDVRIGKLMVLGYVFGCLEECIVIGASLSLKSFFSRQFKEELKTYRYKMHWDNSTYSDCLCSLAAYTEWSRLKDSRSFGGNKEIRWCRENGIQAGRIREVHELVNELTERLKHLNVRAEKPVHKKRNKSPEDVLILKLVIAGAFYPNYFLSGDIDEAEATKLMSGHDPFTTVMVRGMPQYGAQYKAALARMFRDCGKGKALYFEETRAYIEFDKSSSAHSARGSTILPAVYLAIKMRGLRIPLNLYIAEENNKRIESELNNLREGAHRLRTNRMAASLSPGSRQVPFFTNDQPKQVEIPCKGYMEVVITSHIDAGHFWMVNAEQRSSTEFAELEHQIRSMEQYLEPIDRQSCQVENIVLAPFEGTLYRAKVLKIFEDSNRSRTTIVRVFFVDYGNVEEVEFTRLRKIRPDFLKLAFQAIECELCEVQPSYSSKCPAGMWSRQACDRFGQLTQGKMLVAKIYSLVHGILRVDLYDTMTEDDIHINQVLINEGYAQFMEEPYPSKRAHQQAEALRGDVRALDDNMDWLNENSPAFNDTSGQYLTKVSLRGPYNPLEMAFFGITSIGRLRTANVEVDSVNSVALNDQPQDTHQRLLVAANIGINTSGNSVIARDTTLMPNIHGLLPIVALTFAPVAEMRTDPQKHQYTGALVGLGYDPKSKDSLLPDHDIELTFDVEINQEDLILINSLRTGINLAFSNEGMAAEWGSGAIGRIQQACRTNIISLVLKRREDKKPLTFKKQLRWNQVDPRDILIPSTDDKEDTPDLYQLHNGIAITGHFLDDDTPAKVLERRQMNQRLHELAGRSSEPFTEDVVCELCQVRCRHPRGVSLHLSSRCHKDEESILYVN